MLNHIHISGYISEKTNVLYERQFNFLANWIREEIFKN